MEKEQHKQKAKEILRALVYQEIVTDTNREFAGEEPEFDKPLIKECIEYCGLADREYDNLYEEIFEDIDEFEDNTFWRSFSEKVAIVKREEEAEKKKVKFSQDEAFIKLCEFMDEINDKLQDVDQIDLWKYIAKYFK